MELATVTFELIFNVRRVTASLRHARHTEFSFNANGMTQHLVRVPGWPRLQVGDTVTAELREAGNWQSLVGWVNHNTGEIAKPSTARTLRRAAVLSVGVGILVIIIWSVLSVDVTQLGRGKRLLLSGLWAGYGVFLALLAAIVALRRIRWRRDVTRLENILIEKRKSGEIALEVDDRRASTTAADGAAQ